MGKHEKKKPPIDWQKLAAIVTVISGTVQIVRLIIQIIKG